MTRNPRNARTGWWSISNLSRPNQVLNHMSNLVTGPQVTESPCTFILLCFPGCAFRWWWYSGRAGSPPTSSTSSTTSDSPPWGKKKRSHTVYNQITSKCMRLREFPNRILISIICAETQKKSMFIAASQRLIQLPTEDTYPVRIVICRWHQMGACCSLLWWSVSECHSASLCVTQTVFRCVLSCQMNVSWACCYKCAFFWVVAWMFFYQSTIEEFTQPLSLNIATLCT